MTEDGFYTEEEIPTQDGPKMKQKVIKKIPEKVIQRAKGLAIFTTMRSGLWISGAGGSGVLVARREDGTWSPPSGILLHTAGLGFLVGIDIYDCVVVINTDKALEAFTRVRCTLGGEVSAVAGPYGAGAILDAELNKHTSPVFTYLKSRGFYAGVQIDGSIVIERTDENERFYNERIPVKDILAGKVKHTPYEVRQLMETIRAAQGDHDVDESMIPQAAPPGDYELDKNDMFGVPDKTDPDPYGVLALEKEGMSLKEAGTMKRASWEEFSFNPSPSSPVHNIIARHSEERRRSVGKRSSWRTSGFTNESKTTPHSLRNSIDMGLPRHMSDSATQTETPHEPLSPRRPSWISQRSSRGSMSNIILSQMQGVPENDVLNTSSQRKERESATKANGYTTPPHTPPAVQEESKDLPSRLDHDTQERSNELPSPLDHDFQKGSEDLPSALDHDKQEESKDPPSPLDDNDDDDDRNEDVDEDEEIHVEEPAMHSIQTVQPASQMVVTKARLVNVPKLVPPKLPLRNPSRTPVSSSTSPYADLEDVPAESNPNSYDADMSSLSSAGKDSTIDPLHDQMVNIELKDEEKHASTPTNF